MNRYRRVQIIRKRIEELQEGQGAFVRRLKKRYNFKETKSFLDELREAQEAYFKTKKKSRQANID
jgi:hypothetical protein